MIWMWALLCISRSFMLQVPRSDPLVSLLSVTCLSLLRILACSTPSENN